MGKEKGKEDRRKEDHENTKGRKTEEYGEEFSFGVSFFRGFVIPGFVAFILHGS